MLDSLIRLKPKRAGPPGVRNGDLSFDRVVSRTESLSPFLWETYIC